MHKLDAAKLAAVRKLLKANKIDGYVISDFMDCKYILGSLFATPGEAIVMIHAKGVYITARSLYEAPVRQEYPEVQIDGCDQNREQKIIEAAKKLRLKNVAFDSDKEIYSIGKTFVKAGFKEVPSIIDQIRVSKTETEIKTMKASAKILYKAIAHIQKFLKPGVTEKDIALELESYMKKQGASGTSFDTIVAFGPGTGNPHYVTGNVKLKKNVPVLIDFGCIYKNYASDITRTFWYGDKPNAEFTKIYSVVKGAYDNAVKNAKPGMTGAQIDALTRDRITQAGYGQYFTHRTGHGIGMQDHEQADISQINKGKILENYCFSIEPGIYLAGKFGVRYEDCYYMTKQGAKKLA